MEVASPGHVTVRLYKVTSESESDEEMHSYPGGSGGQPDQAVPWPEVHQSQKKNMSITRVGFRVCSACNSEVYV